MRKHTQQPAVLAADQATEAAIQNAITIGTLEHMAGIADRYDFWRPYARMPGATGLDAGVSELKRIIRQNARMSAACAN